MAPRLALLGNQPTGLSPTKIASAILLLLPLVSDIVAGGCIAD
jgi:hypothetical protein